MPSPDPTNPHGLMPGVVTTRSVPAAPTIPTAPAILGVQGDMATTLLPLPTPGLDLHAEVPVADLKLPLKEERQVLEAPADITFEDFLKVDIRVGSVLAAERVPKSDKLLKLQVDFGPLGDRQILAGIGKTFTPEEVVGRQFAFVVNLPPRKMMGLESHGMILAAGESDKLSLVSMFPDDLPDGSRLG